MISPSSLDSIVENRRATCPLFFFPPYHLVSFLLPRGGLHDQTILVNVATKSKVALEVGIDVWALCNWHSQHDVGGGVCHYQRPRTAFRPILSVAMLHLHIIGSDIILTASGGRFLCNSTDKLMDRWRLLAPLPIWDLISYAPWHLLVVFERAHCFYSKSDEGNGRFILWDKSWKHRTVWCFHLYLNSLSLLVDAYQCLLDPKIAISLAYARSEAQQDRPTWTPV